MPHSPSTISWIGSVQTWLTLLIGAFSGRMLDAGLFLPTFFVGAVLQVLGMFLMSISTKYWQLMLTQGVLTGIGGGIFFTPSLALISTYFQSRRGLAIGLATTGNSTGGMIYPLVVRQLIPAVGFPWTARVLAFINMTFLATALAFMRPRLPPRKSGPIIDWSAFKEPIYMTFVAGLFILMWANYYTFYYVGCAIGQLQHTWLIYRVTLIYEPDCLIWQGSFGPKLLQCFSSHHCFKRCRVAF